MADVWELTYFTLVVHYPTVGCVRLLGGFFDPILQLTHEVAFAGELASVETGPQFWTLLLFLVELRAFCYRDKWYLLSNRRSVHSLCVEVGRGVQPWVDLRDVLEHYVGLPGCEEIRLLHLFSYFH